MTTELYTYIREHMEYNPDTGKLLWKKKPRYTNMVIVGREVGSPRGKDGYRQVHLFRTTYLIHRLCWLYHYGEMPNGQIDHIDVNKHNNAISNLRIVNNAQNSQNRRKRSNQKVTSKYKGVYYHKVNNIWIGRIQNDYLGSFRSEEDAALAYNKAALERFGAFARLNNV